MGKKGGRTIKRKVATREYRPVFWISAEGRTERDYFKMDVFRGLEVSLRFPPDIHPSRRNPISVLKRFKKTLRENDFRKNDEAWLVVDVDEWDGREFAALLEWAKADPRHHLAVSNPKFELFLIMHFDSGRGCTTASTVDATLKRLMPGYDKRIREKQFDLDDVQTAIDNAQPKRASCTADLPGIGMTDVYKLVNSLLKHKKGS